MTVRHAEDLLRSLYIMASMVEARDPYTGGHLWRVSQFSRMLAADAGLDASAVARIALGGFLHDLGKIGVPDGILNKPGRLTDDEYAVIKTHPEIGSRLLSGHPLGGLVRTAVLSHHETPDGNGYPQRLAGGAVPFDARVVGICDAFDAMTSNRPYRRGMPIAKALGAIHENLGSQFDRPLGQRFLALGEAGSLDAIVGHSDDGIPVQECPICGPTIVVHRAHRSGDLVYCRHCGGEARIGREDGAIRIESTGRTGTAQDLQADVDRELIDALVAESARRLAPAGIAEPQARVTPAP